MVSGGVSFGVTVGDAPGKAARDGTNFTLFHDQDAAERSTFNPTLKFLLLFDQTVRGLDKKAPVEFRGITIGRVADVSFDLFPGVKDNRIPVLIEIDPALMRPETAREIATPDSVFLKEAVGKGLRASLKTGSLITQALYVDLDYYPDSEPAEIGKAGEFITVPTISSGFAQLEARLTSIMDSVDKATADIAATAKEAKATIAEARDPLNKALKEIEATAAAARKTLEDPEFRELPADLRKSIAALEKSVASVGPDGVIQGDLQRTLDELRAALRAIKSVSTTVDDRPNSLLFGKDSSGNPTPKAPRGGR
jgi:paraquat-inducible protein B